MFEKKYTLEEARDVLRETEDDRLYSTRDIKRLYCEREEMCDYSYNVDYDLKSFFKAKFKISEIDEKTNIRKIISHYLKTKRKEKQFKKEVKNKAWDKYMLFFNNDTEHETFLTFLRPEVLVYYNFKKEVNVLYGVCLVGDIPPTEYKITKEEKVGLITVRFTEIEIEIIKKQIKEMLGDQCNK